MASKRGNVQHIEINVSNLARSKRFYETVLSWMGYRRILDEKNVTGWGNGEVQIFLVQSQTRFSATGFHRKRIGLNHVAFKAESREDVDSLYRELLAPKKITPLNGGPKVYPEYAPSYYAVYFEDPDRIKLEYVHGIE